MIDVDVFITELSRIKLIDVFNPYAEICPIHDKPDAPTIRQNNLRAMLEAGLNNGTKSIWVGRDLGHLGGRRTGVALTDEITMPLIANRSGARGIAKATLTPDMTERTATEVWGAVAFLQEVPIFWNAFPYHPYEPNKPSSNRMHRRDEAQATEHLLTQLLVMFKPSRLIGIGNDACSMLVRMGHSVIHVRHPSYGGQAGFRDGIASAYR